jgi:hypothetical protein
MDPSRFGEHSIGEVEAEDDQMLNRNQNLPEIDRNESIQR